MSSLQKIEEDNLSNIDAYCNEILLPRLNDGSNTAGGDMGALADVLTASLTRAHTQFLTGLDAASKMVREQADGLDRRATENQKLVQENFTKAITSFNETAGKTLTDLGKSAGTSIETLSTTLKKATEHVGALEKVASTQQAQLDASVKETLAKLQQDSSKVIAEAMRSSISETSKAIENTFKPAVEQVGALSEAVKATAAHVGTLQKQASEHQASVQKAMQDAVANVQKDAGKVLEESIKASAAQSSRAIEESIKPAMLHLASIGETAKSAVAEAASLQKQSREQHAAGQQSFIETTAKLQQSLAKALEDAIRPAAQQLGSLGDSVKTAAGHVAALERNAAEQQAAMQRAMQESIARVQEDASRSLAESIRTTATQSSKAMEEVMRPAVAQLAGIGETAKNAVLEAASLQKQSREQHAAGQQSFIETTAKLQQSLAKALEDAVRPAAQQLGSLGESVKAAAQHVATLERGAADQQAALQAAVTRVQEDAARSLAESIRTTAAQSAKAMEEVMRPAVAQLASIGETAKSAITEAASLQKQSREQHAAGQQAFVETTGRLQRDLAKALEDAVRPAAQQLTSLADAVKGAGGHVAGLEKQARDQQLATERAMHEATSQLQRDAARALEEALRPAGQHLASLGEAVKNVISQMSQLDRTSREQQSAAQSASLEVSRQMQRDATKSLEDNLRPVAQQLSALSESIRAVTGQLGGLDRAAADAQATVARSVESNMSRVQQDVARASSEALHTANTQLATLQQGIAALNETLTALGAKQIIIQQVAPAKGGFLGRIMGK